MKFDGAVGNGYGRSSARRRAGMSGDGSAWYTCTGGWSQGRMTSWADRFSSMSMSVRALRLGDKLWNSRKSELIMGIVTSAMMNVQV